MPQLSLYLDGSTLELVQQNAELEHRSLSGYVSNLIREKVSNRWPAGYWELYGSVADESLQRPDQLDFSLDAERISL
jgi:hypothetical protein